MSGVRDVALDSFSLVSGGRVEIGWLNPMVPDRMATRRIRC